MLYAGRRDGHSEAWLIDHFLHVHHEQVAHFMVNAVAAALTLSGRREIAHAARHVWASDHRKRFVELLATVHHPDFVELIGYGMECLDINEEDYHSLAFALGQTGDRESLAILKRELRRCIDTHVSHREADKFLSECVELTRFMLEVSAQETFALLSEIRDTSQDAFLQSAINAIIDMVDPLNQDIF